MLKKMKKVAAITTMLCLLGANTVLAAEPAPDAVLTGGTLANTELGIAAFTPVTLNGTTQTITAVVSTTTLTDSRGSGDGWNVSLYASPFTLDLTSSSLLTGGTPIADAIDAIVGTGTVETPQFPAVPAVTTALASPLGVLTTGHLAIGAVSMVDADPSLGSSAPAGITKATSGNIDTATVAGINILNAPVDEGMGKYTVSMADMTLTLSPKTTYAGTYTSTVTETLTSGPVV